MVDKEIPAILAIIGFIVVIIGFLVWVNVLMYFITIDALQVHILWAIPPIIVVIGIDMIFIFGLISLFWEAGS